MQTTLEEVTTMAEKLTPSEKIKLVKHLAISLEKMPFDRKQPQDLYGSWSGKFPEDTDVEAIIREIRDEWKKELDEL
jgi:hypothetical protein